MTDFLAFYMTCAFAFIVGYGARSLMFAIVRRRERAALDSHVPRAIRLTSPRTARRSTRPTIPG